MYSYTKSNIHVINKCERSEPEKLKLNCRKLTCYNWMQAKRAGIFLKLNCRERSERKNCGKICTFAPNSSKLMSDYLFSFQKRTYNLFQAFSRSEYLFPKSASPPPPLRIKWSSPKSLCSNVLKTNYLSWPLWVLVRNHTPFNLSNKPSSRWLPFDADATEDFILQMFIIGESRNVWSGVQPVMTTFVHHSVLEEGMQP